MKLTVHDIEWKIAILKELNSKELYSKELYSKELYSKELYSKELYSKELYSKDQPRPYFLPFQLPFNFPSSKSVCSFTAHEKTH
jgi:hypothetical protein